MLYSTEERPERKTDKRQGNGEWRQKKSIGSIYLRYKIFLKNIVFMKLIII